MPELQPPNNILYLVHLSVWSIFTLSSPWHFFFHSFCWLRDFSSVFTDPSPVIDQVTGGVCEGIYSTFWGCSDGSDGWDVGGKDEKEQTPVYSFIHGPWYSCNTTRPIIDTSKSNQSSRIRDVTSFKKKNNPLFKSENTKGTEGLFIER